MVCPGKVDVRLPGARPVHLIITMIKWVRTGRLSIKNYLFGVQGAGGRLGSAIHVERGAWSTGVPPPPVIVI